MESKLSDETLDVLPILLDDNTTDMGLALVHLSDVTQAGIQAANQGNRCGLFTQSGNQVWSIRPDS
jgi:hypothetical protein